MAVALDTTVRPARWPEYFGLAWLAARRLSSAPQGTRQWPRPLHALGLWLTAVLSLAAYGGLTTEHHQAMATLWLVDDNEWRAVLRALPAIAVLLLIELALFILTPSWVPYVAFVLTSLAMLRLGLRWRARAELRQNRRQGAIYIGNLVSARKGAGKVLLEHITADADARGLFTCLEACGHPDLIAYYADSGFAEVRSVRAGRDRIVYMERPPCPIRAS